MTTASVQEAAPSAAVSSRTMLWTGRVLSGLFVLFMALDVSIKLVNLPVVDQTMAKLGWAAGAGSVIGWIELVTLVLYLVPQTSVLGAVLLTGVFGGAAATHWRVGDPLASHILFGVYLGLFMWGGLWLRRPALRAVFPLQRKA